MLAVLGRWDEAVVALEAAGAAAAGAGARPVAADVRCTLARALLGRGREDDRARGAELLDDVAAEAAALGMVHLSSRVEEARAGAGASRPPRGRPPAPALPALSLARDGEVWTVRFGDRTALLEHSRGLEVLDALVRAPGRALHVLALAGADRAEPVDRGDAGELLDPRARAAYRARVADREEELRQAEAWNDVARRSGRGWWCRTGRDGSVPAGLAADGGGEPGGVTT